MTHLLPPNLLRLFAPRPPIPYLKPLVRDPEIPLHKKLDGVAAILEELREENALREADEEAKRSEEQKAAEAAKAKTGGGDGMQVDSKEGIKVKKEQSQSDVQTNGVKKEDADMEEGESKEELSSTTAEGASAGLDKDAKAKTATAAVEGEPVFVQDVPAGEALIYEEKGLLLDDSGKPFTYTEGEKLRQRRILRKLRREQNFAKALEKCTYTPHRYIYWSYS